MLFQMLGLFGLAAAAQVTLLTKAANVLTDTTTFESRSLRAGRVAA